MFEKISSRGGSILGLTSGGQVVLLSGPGYTDTLIVASTLFGGPSVDPTAIYLGEEYALVGTRTSVLAFTSDFEFQAQAIESFSSIYGVNELSLTPLGALVVISGPVSYFFSPDRSGERPWEEVASQFVSVPFPASGLSVGNDRIYVSSTSGRVAVLSALSGQSIGSGTTAQQNRGFVPLDVNGGNVVTLTPTQIQLWDWTDPSAPAFSAGFDMVRIVSNHQI